MVYTAESQSLAALEIMAHLESSELIEKYLLFEVKIDRRLILRLGRRHLPPNWAADLDECRAIGDEWIADGTSVALEVPSTIIPAEHNYLLNPGHPAFSRLAIGKPTHFRFDPRLGNI
jgi:RES domain-containing protein